MRVICITLDDERYNRSSTRNGCSGNISPLETRQHFAARGVDAHFFRGIPAEKVGIDTTLPYDVDYPGRGNKISPAATGIWVSHRMLWAACLLLPDDLFFIVEDDSKFPTNWVHRVNDAMTAAGDFNMLFVGSCCTAGKPSKHVAGDVYEVKWPMCLHGYIVRRRVLETLILGLDEARCYAPVDIALLLHVLPKLGGVYTVIPRILEQHNYEGLPV